MLKVLVKENYVGSNLKESLLDEYQRHLFAYYFDPTEHIFSRVSKLSKRLLQAEVGPDEIVHHHYQTLNQILETVDSSKHQEIMFTLHPILSECMMVYSMMDLKIKDLRGDLEDRQTELFGMKERLERSAREKEALLREVNHRVKNNFQVILSLLDLQTEEVENTKARATITDCQNRIRSMAFIHDLIYNSNDFTGINLKEYIHPLIVSILNSYEITFSSVDCHIAIAPIELDIDRSTSLGLIINELVSLCIKSTVFLDPKVSLMVTIELAESNGMEVIVGYKGTSSLEIQPFTDPQSIDLRFILNLVTQLNGVVEIGRDQGFQFKINLPFTNLK